MNDVEKEALQNLSIQNMCCNILGKHKDAEEDIDHPVDVKHDVVLDMLENLHKFGVKFIIRDFVSQLVPKALKEVV